MKKFAYAGTSILSFSHKGFDYVVFGSGPHSLPEDNTIVKSRVKQGILIQKKIKKSI